MGSNDWPAYGKAGCAFYFNCLLTVKTKKKKKKPARGLRKRFLPPSFPRIKRRSTFVSSEMWRAARDTAGTRGLTPNYWQVFAKSSVWEPSKILIRLDSLSPGAY